MPLHLKKNTVFIGLILIFISNYQQVGDLRFFFLLGGGMLALSGFVLLVIHYWNPLLKNKSKNNVALNVSMVIASVIVISFITFYFMSL